MVLLPPIGFSWKFEGDLIPGVTAGENGVTVLDLRAFLIPVTAARFAAQRMIMTVCRISVMQAMAMHMDSAEVSCPPVEAGDAVGVSVGVGVVSTTVGSVVVVMLQTWSICVQVSS